MKGYTEEELEDWLSKIENVNKKVGSIAIITLKQVKDIVDGTVDIEEFDKKQAEEEKIDKIKDVIKEREQKETLLKGRPGKGNQKGYVSFCRFCFTEYVIEVPKCTHCSKETISYEVSLTIFCHFGITSRMFPS